MPQIDLHQDGMDPGWILAIMKFPSDAEMRRSYYAVTYANVKLKDRGRSAAVEISDELFEAIVHAPGEATLREQDAARTKRAFIAGDFLLSIYVMYSFPKFFAEPSVRKAVFIAQERARVARFGDGTKLPTSETAIRKYFEEFRSVAHLWAAMGLHGSYPIREQDEILASAEAVRDFLGIAGTLQDFGSNFVPKRAKLRQPLLDAASLWRVPDSAKRLVPSWESPPTWLVRTAEKYKVKR